MKTLLQNDLLSLSYCLVRVTIRTSSVPGWSGWWITGLAKKFVPSFCVMLWKNLNKPFGQPNALEPLGHKEPEKFHSLGSSDGGDVAKRGRVSCCPHPPRTSCGNPTIPLRIQYDYHSHLTDEASEAWAGEITQITDEVMQPVCLEVEFWLYIPLTNLLSTLSQHFPKDHTWSGSFDDKVSEIP